MKKNMSVRSIREEIKQEKRIELLERSLKLLRLHAEQWELGMKALNVSSREYKALCMAGKKAMSAHHVLFEEMYRSLTPEQIDKYENNIGYCFN